MTHPIFLFKRSESTLRELENTQQVIKDSTGVTPCIARPPCGVRTLAYFEAADRLGLKTVQWSVAGFDWKDITARKITDYVLKDLRAGSIVLLHDGDETLTKRRTETVRALPAIIEGAWAKNLRISPLSEICADYD